MKPSEFADALVKGAGMMTGPDAENFMAIAEMFASSPAASVAATLARVDKAKIAPLPDKFTVTDTIGAFGKFREFTALYAKPALAKDVQALVAFLEHHSTVGFRPLIEQARLSLTKGKLRTREQLVLRESSGPTAPLPT